MSVGVGVFVSGGVGERVFVWRGGRGRGRVDVFLIVCVCKRDDCSCVGLIVCLYGFMSLFCVCVVFLCVDVYRCLFSLAYVHVSVH